MPGGAGGKRAGAGRKSGPAWASKRPPASRKIARATVERIMREGDPLDELLALARDTETPIAERIRAYGIIMPHVRPRLSMSVVAEAKPNKHETVEIEQLRDELMRRIARVTPTVTIEAESVGCNVGDDEDPA